jgi:putative RNA 2'-phosphotransferase
MDKSDLVNKSKFLSLVLRHKPEQIGLVLDSNGWANVDEILQKMQIDFETLQTIVDTNDKKRFTFNEDESKIRANQGHSIQVDVQLEEKEPPEVLYHGTASRFLESIMDQGLTKQKRQYVHLSKDEDTAIKVGQRHGKPTVLIVSSKLMFDNGYKFYLSINGVWLTNFICQLMELVDRSCTDKIL